MADELLALFQRVKEVGGDVFNEYVLADLPYLMIMKRTNKKVC
jgi:hypothetical protein